MQLVQDFRFALRMLAKAPGFTAVAVLCLALGIGANSTAFSLIDGMWMRPLPVEKPGELVYLFEATGDENFGEVSYPEYEEFSHARSLAGLAVSQRRGPTLTGAGFAESTMSDVVSETYFTVLGVNAQLGRVFTAHDTGGEPVVVMSHNMWQRRFGGDPGIVGKAIRLGRAYTVIGIAPKGFRGTDPWVDCDFWIPMSSWSPEPDGEQTERAFHSFSAVGRLRPGVTLEQARAEIRGIAANLERAFPQFDKGRRGVLYSALEYKVRSGGFMAEILLSVVGVVLLIACANVANLLLARAGSRAHEIGVRVALGAKRSRLVRQLLTESAVIAAMGTAAGLILADGLIQVLPAIIVPPGSTHTKYAFRLDFRVLAVTLAVSLATVLAFGLFPALRASRPDVSSVIKGVVGQGRSLRWPQPRNLLVIAQVALSMILLTAAGLLIRTFVYSMHSDLGFQRKDLLVAEVEAQGELPQIREFYRQLEDRVRSYPSVLQVTLAMRPPLWGSEGGSARNVGIPRRPLAPGQMNPRVKSDIIGENYFRTLGIPLLRGRDFDAHDGPDAPKVVIVSERMARRFWPNEDALGRFLYFGNDPRGPQRQVIGVAGDAHINSVQEEPEPYVYVPYAQTNRETIMLLAETKGDPLRLVPQFRADVASLDKGAPLLAISTLGLVVRASAFEQQTAATVIGILGALALFLAAIGLYGIMAYSTVRRTREIGIRMALGAARADALHLVLREGLRLAAAGIALGFAGALALTRGLTKMLYGVSPRDPVTLLSVALLMLAVALIATFIPARRATRVDPLVALRYE